LAARANHLTVRVQPKPEVATLALPDLGLRLPVLVEFDYPHNNPHTRIPNMAKKPAQNTVTVRRSAVTGKFVTKAKVKDDPRETETEKRPIKRK
jgi:hypothetical protein